MNVLARAALLAAVAVSASLGAAAQRPVVTVGGSNPDHVDLPAAIAAATPGSIVEVRPGSYTGFATDKPLRLVLRGCTIQPPAGAAYAVTIHDLHAPGEFVVVGKSATIVAGTLGAVRIAHCSRPVLIESVIALAGALQPALDVFDAGAVHVARSILAGEPGLQTQLAVVVSSENVIGSITGVGAVVQATTLELQRSVLIGNRAPALRLLASSARLASDGTGVLSVLGTSTVPVSAFEAVDSVVTWDPTRFVLLPLNGAPPFASSASTVLVRDVPMLNAGPAPLGGSASVRMVTAAPTAGLVGVGGVQPVPMVSLGAVLLQAPTSVVMALAGVAGPTGLAANFQVPNSAALRGEVFCLQAVAFAPDGTATISGPAIWAVE